MARVEIDGVVNPFGDGIADEIERVHLAAMVAERTGGLDVDTTYERCLEMCGGDTEAADELLHTYLGDLIEVKPQPDISTSGSLPDIVDKQTEL